MKKVVITFALCLVVSFSFGQKKNVSAAKNEMKGEKPNVGEARALISAALENPETANDPEAWYVAGLLENKQFDTEKAKELFGMEAIEDIMYPALDMIYSYFEKADLLDQIPDEKGKVKPKFRKDMKGIMFANRPYYINAGSYFYEKENYQKAFENFKMYASMAKLPMFAGDENKFGKVKDDTTAIKILYFAAISASLIPNADATIEILEEIKDYGFEENDVYQRLASEYYRKGDTLNFSKTLDQGAVKFPNESYYILNLINLYIGQGEIEKSVNYLQRAIAGAPNDPQFYDVLGLVYESDNKIDEAIASIEKALVVKPDYQEALSHLGRLYYNQGVGQRAKADEIQDKGEYERELAKAQDYFKKALTYFETAYELNPSDGDAIFALRNIYYNLGMSAEYEKMDEIYSGGNE